MCVLLALLAVFTGCATQQAGQELAKTGTDTANTLTSYYETLAADLRDTQEWEGFNSAMRGVPYDPGQLDAQIAAVKARASMARDLANTYSALGKLAEYDARGEVSGAATDLSKSVSSLPGLKPGVDPSSIVGAVAGDVAALGQARSIRDASDGIAKTLAAVQDLVAKEKDYYVSIPEERANKAVAVTDTLIQQRLVNPTQLIETAPAAVGLELNTSGEKLAQGRDSSTATTRAARVALVAGRTGGDGLAAADPPAAAAPPAAPAADRAVTRALVAVMRVKMGRSTDAAEAAIDDLQGTLTNLSASHAQLAATNQLDVTQAQVLLERAKYYVDEMAKLRGGQSNGGSSAGK